MSKAFFSYDLYLYSKSPSPVPGSLSQLIMADAAQIPPSSVPGLKRRYEAAMVLGAVGDAMG